MRIKGERERESGQNQKRPGVEEWNREGGGGGGGAGRTKKDNMIDMSNMSVSSHHQ